MIGTSRLFLDLWLYGVKNISSRMTNSRMEILRNARSFEMNTVATLANAVAARRASGVFVGSMDVEAMPKVV